MDNARTRRCVFWKAALLLFILLLTAYAGWLFGFSRLVYPRKYAATVEDAAMRFSVPTALLYAVIHTESGFNPDAVSEDGAEGLMQIMPATYRQLREEMPGYASLALGSKAEENIYCGAYYLSLLYARFGNWDAAIAAYNAGPGTVEEWLKESGTSFLEHIPYSETERYLLRVKTAAGEYRRLYCLTEKGE